jgi:hypothetical protein
MDIPYPSPLAKVGGRNVWTKGQHRKYIAKLKGEPHMPQSDDDDLMTAAQVKKALGGVSSMWLHRHIERPASNAA